MPRPDCPCPPPLQRVPGHPEFFPSIQRFSLSSSRPLQPSAPSGTPPLPHRVNQRSSNLTIRAAVYISLYVDVNTFVGGRQPQKKLMRLRTFKKILYDQWMILQTVNFSHLLCVGFGFRVRTSQKCLFFVCLLFFFQYFCLEKAHISPGSLGRISPRPTHFLAGCV